jgi:Oxidoreductase molybdopterin binding domain
MSDQHELPPDSVKPRADDIPPAAEPVVEPAMEVASASSAKPSASDPSAEVPLHAEAQADQQESDDSPVEAQTAPPDFSPEEVEAQVRAANELVLRESRKHTRRSFVFAASAAFAGYELYHWLNQAPAVEMQPYPLRRAFQTNAAIARGVTRDHALAPTYPLKDARDIRVNGVYGLKKTMVPESWRLQVVGVRGAEHLPQFTPDVTAWEYEYIDVATHEDQGHDTKVDPNARTSEKMAPEPMLNQARRDEDRKVRMPRGTEEAGASSSTLMPGTSGLLLTMQDILALPRYELVTQFKCIEGWSEIVHWAGIRMSDFMEAYPPALIDGREPRYVYMETPDGDYYTGYDLEVCRHPQTLLVTEMMGAPLTQFHGAPLRLHMPTKYGYKQIKRIALISYTDRKPDDYWTKLGYDWYGGL